MQIKLAYTSNICPWDLNKGTSPVPHPQLAPRCFLVPLCDGTVGLKFRFPAVGSAERQSRANNSNETLTLVTPVRRVFLSNIPTECSSFLRN